MAEAPQLSTPETELPPPPPQLPYTVEEADEGGGEDGEGKVEINPRIAAPLLILPPAVALFHPSSPSYSPILKKCAGRRKKNFLNAKQRAVAEQRLQLLNENFHPVSFSPGKTLDFSAHEQLFEALGLLDFAHLELDVEVRPDLLAHLIAYYDPSNRRSYVNGTRISVSRVDLARAIGLPSKKDKANAPQGKDSIQHLIFADGAIPILLDFMSNYMLFEDDMCILPQEIIQAIQFVKEGVPYKVDWASVLWVFVEKELLEAPKTGSCFYASHLQRLIKNQHPLLFSKKLEPVLPPEPENEEEEVPIADDAVNAVDTEINAAEEVPLEEEEEEADHGFRKMRSLVDLVNVAADRHNSEFGLTLGESVMNGFDDCKVNEKCQWFDGKNAGFEQCLLQRCNSKAFGSMDFDILTTADEEEKERFTDDFSVKISNLERLTSPDHFDEMENMNTPAQQVNSSPSSDTLLTSRSNSHKNIILDHGLSGSINFGNHGKRKVDGIVDEEEDQFDHNNQQKGMRSYQPWSNLPPSSLDECLDQIHCGIKRTRMLFAEKDQGLVNMEMQVQYLNHLLQEKEQTIRSLKMVLEGQPNWQMSVRQYEDELCLVTQMMLGYKRALKESRSRFSDYRKMHPHDEESLYKDLPGEGGLVLSAREFEKYQVVQEEDKRQKMLGTFSSLEKILNKFEKCEEGIMVHDSKLEKLVGEMEHLKEGFVRSNCSDT